MKGEYRPIAGAPHWVLGDFGQSCSQVRTRPECVHMNDATTRAPCCLLACVRVRARALALVRVRACALALVRVRARALARVRVRARALALYCV